MYPHSVSCCPESEEIFVSDKWSHCIFVFNKSGEYLRTLGNKGDGFGSFRAPEGIAVSGNKIFVCDTANDRIQVILLLINHLIIKNSIISNVGYYFINLITVPGHNNWKYDIAIWKYSTGSDTGRSFKEHIS